MIFSSKRNVQRHRKGEECEEIICCEERHVKIAELKNTWDQDIGLPGAEVHWPAKNEKLTHKATYKQIDWKN